MTFKEAYEKAERSARAHDGYVGVMAWNQILDRLQATYAPKIKMTKAQFDFYTIAIDLYDTLEDILNYRWDTPSITEDSYNDEVREIRILDDKTLALAWLYPELVEVVE
ncbi:hypothetical protein [Pseudolactococcus reticulitermitis]|uniref:Uncharacterized protein n=1 Tax=Pseudolactococcus reticulitermitis TaxID=2025039 RepID=A0A224XBI6_9LACT|nr:hypothetical protein [Lactococcus reticulitermitis]GAX47292.1 hypothetical protein RsY01_891 [Lactococcus reticulitermitis]